MTRISKDPRNALRLSEDDRRKNNTVIPGLLFFPVIPVFFSSPLSFPYSFLPLCHSRAWHGNLKRDVRLKAGHDIEKSPSNEGLNKNQFFIFSHKRRKNKRFFSWPNHRLQYRRRFSGRVPVALRSDYCPGGKIRFDRC